MCIAMLTANVILPAAGMPYLSLFVLSPVVLVAEGLVLYRFNRDLTARSLVPCVVGVNVASFVVGIFLVDHLWVGHGMDVDERSITVFRPDWSVEVLHGFVQAGVLSFLIETAALLPFKRLAGLNRVVVPMFLANALSYLILFAIFWLSCGMMRY